MTLSFAEVEVPDDPKDSAPVTSDVEYPCNVCGREAGPYGGRGRRPTRCPDHKSQSHAGSAKPRGANAALAAQATDALIQINGLVALAAIIGGYVDTAGAIAASEEDFRERTQAALLTDAALCRTILKAGTSSAKVALCISYAMIGVGVIPTAVNEYREKKAAAEALSEVEA